MTKILVIDDDIAINELVKINLAQKIISIVYSIRKQENIKKC